MSKQFALKRIFLYNSLKWGEIDIHSSTGSIVISIDFFSYFHHPGASWGFLSCSLYFLVFSWLLYQLPKTAIEILRKYKQRKGEDSDSKVYFHWFCGFALLCFQAVTSCPLRGLFSIGWETKQLSCFPFKLALFNNHNNNNKNNNVFSFTKFSKLYNLSQNYNLKFKLHAV